MPARNTPADVSLKDFYRQLGKASRRLLMCDYDGTLAPFKQDRLAAVPYPGVREVLQAIQRSQRTDLVIVSGREVAEVERLLALGEPVEIWGCHGWQRKTVDGQVQQAELPPAARASLDTAQQSDWPRSQLEIKPVSLALHWRGLGDDERLRLEIEAERLWGPLAAQGGLELHRFNGGVELRCPARTKGDVVSQLLTEKDYDVSAYLGDDRTDEDAFRALQGQGLSVLVLDHPRETHAQLRLAPPVELLQFLAHWHLLAD